VLWQMHQGTIKNIDETISSSNDEQLYIIPQKLEKMVKQFKTHRCALDFDYSFCKTVFNIKKL